MPVYVNPVYSHSFPDPFVLRFNGRFFAYCTGHWNDGRIFGVLTSTDLVQWCEIGGAMTPLTEEHPHYWAPEVTYNSGIFYLYYSVGNETLMEIRVATSMHPDGGFEDRGIKLTTEEFAIDPHVFLDDDGAVYMFYATDFLAHTHIGTGVVMDRMLGPFELEGQPKPIIRARYDWQVYHPARKEKGGVRWHTVEGPFVFKRKRSYFAMFSGGNWQEPSYGVGFAVTKDIDSDVEWEQNCDGSTILPVLRTIPGSAVGPGHNSVVCGPDGRELFCVYHLWQNGERVMAIDRMGIAGDRIFVIGASTTPQMAPLAASITLDDREAWAAEGDWSFRNGGAENTGKAPATIRCSKVPSSFLCEFSFLVTKFNDAGSFGIDLLSADSRTFRMSIDPTGRSIKCAWTDESGTNRESVASLAADLNIAPRHHVRIEKNGSLVQLRLDDTFVIFNGVISINVDGLSLFADSARMEFSGFSLTDGFEDRFDDVMDKSSRPGWSITSGPGQLAIRDQQLVITNESSVNCVVSKQFTGETFEFLINARLASALSGDAAFGFILIGDERTEIYRLEISETRGRGFLPNKTEATSINLPDKYDAGSHHQFRFLSWPSEISIDIEGFPIATLAVQPGERSISLFARQCEAEIDMARLTMFRSNI